MDRHRNSTLLHQKCTKDRSMRKMEWGGERETSKQSGWFVFSLDLIQFNSFQFLINFESNDLYRLYHFDRIIFEDDREEDCPIVHHHKRSNISKMAPIAKISAP